MAKDMKYIRKRKRKYGVAFLVEIPYTDNLNQPQRFTETVKITDFAGNEKSALMYAQKIRNEALQEIASGKMQTQYPTVEQAYEMKWSILPLSVSTRDKQDAIYSHAIAPYASIPMDKVSASDIQSSLNVYAETHSDDGIRRLLAIWRQLYTVCSVLEYNLPDKTGAVIVPKSKRLTKRRNQSMNMSDFTIILNAVLQYNAKGIESYDSRCVWYLLILMYYTGCRPAELLALTRSDIHADFISITKQVGSTTKKRLQIVPTKTADSVRNVPIADDLRPILFDLLRWSRYDLLLADRQGNPRNVSHISDVIGDIARKNGIDFHLYMLRHLMSTQLINAGNSIIARDILGHSSFGMTLNYARSTDEQLFKALRSRSLAENQPKKISTFQHHSDISKQYAILRLQTAIRLSILEKTIFEAQKKTAV